MSKAAVISLAIILVPPITANLCASRAHGDEKLRTRFQSEARAGWRKLRESIFGLQGTCISRVGTGDVSSGLGSQNTQTLKSSHGTMIHQITTSNNHTKRTILRCINPDYAFSIKKEKEGDPWVVARIGRDFDQVRDKIQQLGYPFFSSLSIEGQDLESIVSRPGFKLEAIEPLLDGGRELARLDFSAEKFERQNYQIRGGHIVLDPNRYWAVVSYELRLQLHQSCSSIGRVEYDEDEIDGFPVPKLYSFHVQGTDPGDGPFDHRVRCEIHLQKGQAAEAESRLPFYGLPEPSSTVRRGWPSWSYPMAVALICLAISGLLARKAQQTRKKADSREGLT